MNRYWKDLVSIALRALQDSNQLNAVYVIKNGHMVVEHNSFDNWNGGINYWDLVFELKYKDYMTIENRKNEIEGVLQDTIESFHTNERELIANVLIRPAIERYIDWRALLPETKDSTITLIESEINLLKQIATGQVSFKDDGVEQTYQKRHRHILELARKGGFDYPITANTLSEWWIEVKKYSTWAERRAYISELVTPLLKELRDSDEEATTIDFSQMARRSGTIKKALNDAEMFLREGKSDSAFDRVHTALHGYLKELLDEHEIEYGQEDIPALFSKLHSFYGNAIEPPEVAERIKKILRSGGGMITAVNELRNNNTVSHPNEQLINKREAELAIGMINAVVNYIEDIEKHNFQNDTL